MKYSYVWIMALALMVASGCAKNQNSDEMDLSSDDAATADTASVDDGGAPEGDATQTASAEPTPETTNPETVLPEEDTSANTWNNTAEAAPVAAAAPVEAAPTAVYGSGVIDNYVVQKGDTLMKIAFNLYGDIDAWKQIYNMNRDHLQHAAQLRAGMQLKYDKPASAPNLTQNGEPYLIQKGDTLGRISSEVYATTRKWRKLWENNRQLIKDPNRIFAGFYLYYQITEEEKQMAEKNRASRSAASTGGSVSAGFPAAAMPPAEAAPVPAAAAAPQDASGGLPPATN
jgi:nucleoid-associated protein YgaU